MADQGNLDCTVRRQPFGNVGSEAVETITLDNGRGIEARIITYGASIQSLLVPGSDGAIADVALGYATAHEYAAQAQYIGESIGRVANRIAGGRFSLDGSEYRVPVNNGPNSLHGGTRGFDKANWSVLDVGGGERAHVTLGHVSPDGDQGFPGILKVTATYALDATGALSIEYCAATDRTTLVNLTNHAYWNLSGDGSAEGAMGHLLTIFADDYLPTDETAIPTGEICSVEGSAFDFRSPVTIGERVRDASDEQIRFGRGYDHNWVIARDVAEAPRQVARLEHPGSGRVMDVLSNQPGLQFYSGNFLDATTWGKGRRLYRMGDGIALEPQQFPDTPNQPEFGSLRLEPGDTYRNLMIFHFSAR